MIKQFPYRHIQKNCILEVEYSINSDPVTSGFEIVKDLLPDLNICIGYPTIHAYIKKHEGFGFCRYCGFIQILEINNGKEKVRFVDIPPVFQEKGDTMVKLNLDSMLQIKGKEIQS